MRLRQESPYIIFQLKVILVRIISCNFHTYKLHCFPHNLSQSNFAPRPKRNELIGFYHTYFNLSQYI